MTTNKHIVFGFTAGISLFIAACGNGSGKTPVADPNQVKSYQVITVQPQTAELHTDFPATIEGQQIVEIRPRVDGYIEQIYVDEGAVVRKGQNLFRINSDIFTQQVRTAEANVRIAQSNVSNAQMKVSQVRPLVEKDIISKYELETAQINLQSMRASLAAAQAQLKNARTNLSYSLVTSPVNGVIGRIPYKVGALVSSNIPEPLTTVASVAKMYAYFSMNEKQVLDFTKSTGGNTLQAKLAKLPAVELILPDGSEYPQKGRIETASALINTETGSSNFRATFPNPLGLLRSGSTGTVRIPTVLSNTILVPQKSTYEIQGKRFVYLLTADSVKSTPVQVNPSASGLSFVVQEGLKAGDKIVIEGIAGLREGAKIKPVEVNADSLFNSLK
jgi:membrane fusion protein, multidrug efflux system